MNTSLLLHIQDMSDAELERADMRAEEIARRFGTNQGEVRKLLRLARENRGIQGEWR